MFNKCIKNVLVIVFFSMLAVLTPAKIVEADTSPYHTYYSTYNGYKLQYELPDFCFNNALLTSYDLSSTSASAIDITIPSSIDGHEMYGVSNNIFGNYNSKVKSVTIENGVKIIFTSAFDGCTNLTSVNIPGSVTEIEQYAFQYCGSLAGISIPNSVSLLGFGAFQYCHDLKSITISNSAVCTQLHINEIVPITTSNPIFYDTNPGYTKNTAGTVKSISTYVGDNEPNYVNDYFSLSTGYPLVTSIPLSSTTASAIAASLSPDVGEKDTITFKLEGTSSSINDFNGEHEVMISGVKKAADGSYGNASFTRDGSLVNMPLTDDSASDLGQVMLMDFNSGQAQFDIYLNASGSQDITFDIDGAIKAQPITITPVSAITSVSTLQDISVQKGTALSSVGLPQNVIVNLSDSTSTSAAVTWNGGSPTYDGNAEGEYTFTGIITNPAGVINPNNKTALVKVHVGNDTTPQNSNSGNSGGDGGSISGSKSVTGSIIDDITGKKISDINADVTTYYNGKSTVSMDMSKVIEIRQPDGSIGKLDDISKISVLGSSGSYIPISSSGIVQIDNLIKGTDNNFKIAYDFGNGQKINIGSIAIKIGTDGNVSLSTTLIDPYGKIVDEATGKAVEGAKVTLYYANTERNKASGKTPDAEVSLPKIDGFKPNNNVNPQSSDSYGAYGFMVFPDTDYYLVIEKDGYNKYTSPTISVGKDIVKWNVDLHVAGTERLYGQDRIDTNLQITKAAFPNGFSNVVLASSENYPDALSGSVLSYKLNAPILLVGSSDTDKAKVFSYLENNISTGGTVYILGGTGSIGKDVEDKLSSDGFKNIVRLGGQDRFETAVKIDDKIGAKEGTPVVIVSGENYPDALSISSIAAQNGYPIFMTPKDKIPDEVKEKVSALKPSKVYIIGLEGVISKNIENQILSMTSLDSKNIIRIGGKDRFETSLDVAKYFGLSGSIECAASGNNFPDALSGSIYAAENKAHVILVGDKLSDSQTQYLKNSKLSGITILGGSGAVNAEIQDEISKAISK